MSPIKKYGSLIAILLIVGNLVACSSPGKKTSGAAKQSTAGDGAPYRHVDIASISNAVPKREPRSKYGNPKSYVVFGKRYHTLNSSKGFVQRGVASWYGTKFHGKRTSSGEPYDMFAMTAAHKTLPLPSYVEVTNLDNGRKVIVKVNDRGPFVSGRIIDLSHTAARKLNIVGSGTGRVEIRAIDPGKHRARNKPSKPVKVKSPALSSEQLFVQIGAFGNSSNAKNLQKNLYKRLGSDFRINTYFNETKKLYRVRIGPIASNEDAKRVHARLNRIGFSGSHIVSESLR